MSIVTVLMVKNPIIVSLPPSLPPSLRSSLGPAGIFCSLFYSVQRLRTEKMLDIFQAVQMTQLQRPGCVSNMMEYVFLYDCVHEFLVKNS